LADHDIKVPFQGLSQWKHNSLNSTGRRLNRIKPESLHHFIIAYQIWKIKLVHFKTSIDHIQKKEPDGKSNPSGHVF